MEVTTPKLWLSRYVGVIQKLDVNDIIIIVIEGCVTWLSFALVGMANTFRLNKGGLVNSILWPHVS